MSDLECGLNGLADSEATNTVVAKGFKGVNGQLTCYSELDCPSCGSRIDLIEKVPFQNSSCTQCGAEFLVVAMLGQRFALNDKLNETPSLCTFYAEDLENDFNAILKVFDNRMIVDRDAFLADLNKIKGDLFFAGGAVARIVSVGELNGSVFLCRGVTTDSLNERLQRDGRLDLYEALRVIREVADAYYSVAAKGILPALVSPGNVLYNDKNELQVSDIGVAEALYKQAGSRQEMLAHFFQLGYASPEFLDSGQVTLKGTVYSLGVLAYELISGNFPYSAQSIDELRKQQGVPCVALMAAVPGLPQDISGLVSEMMAIDPETRPSSFAKVVERIDQIVSKNELFFATEEEAAGVQVVSPEMPVEPLAEYDTPVAKAPKKTGGRKQGVKIHASAGAVRHAAEVRRKAPKKSTAPLIVIIVIILAGAGFYVSNKDMFTTPPPPVVGKDTIIDNTQVKSTESVAKTADKFKTNSEKTPKVTEFVKRKPLTLAERGALRKSIRPANMDFGAMRAKLYQYRDAFPEGELREREVLRFDILTSLKEDLESKLTPYGDQGLYQGFFYPKNGTPFLGALKSISEEKGFGILTDKGREVTLKWEEVELKQYPDFMVFLACNESADFTLERYDNPDFSNIANNYLVMAVLYDWYDLKKEALAAKVKAIRLDPSLQTKLDLLISVE